MQDRPIGKSPIDLGVAINRSLMVFEELGSRVRNRYKIISNEEGRHPSSGRGRILGLRLFAIRPGFAVLLLLYKRAWWDS